MIVGRLAYRPIRQPSKPVVLNLTQIQALPPGSNVVTEKGVRMFVDNDGIVLKIGVGWNRKEDKRPGEPSLAKTITPCKLGTAGRITKLEN